jgi:hypothetical protein
VSSDLKDAVSGDVSCALVELEEGFGPDDRPGDVAPLELAFGRRPSSGEAQGDQWATQLPTPNWHTICDLHANLTSECRG